MVAGSAEFDRWQRLFLFSRADTIYGGSDEIQHDIIADPRPRPAPELERAPMNGHNLLDGKVVVVTAAAGTGIGSAAARRCLEEGARVVISDQHERRLAATRDELAQAHGDAAVAALPCDVTDEAQVQALIEDAVGRFGRIDVMINNAGLGGTSPILEMTDEQWLKVLDVTLNGTFRCTRAALRQMVAQGGGGAVVNNASVLGWRAQPGQAHYAAAKAGVMALTRCAALDVGRARHPGQRGRAQPGHPPLPGQGDQRGPARPTWPPASPSAAPPSPGKSPTSWSSWPATTPATSPARSSPSAASTRKPAPATAARTHPVRRPVSPARCSIEPVPLGPMFHRVRS